MCPAPVSYTHLRIQGSAGPLGDIPRGPDIHAGRVPFREGRRVGCQNGFLCPHQRRIRAGFMIKNVRGRPAKRSLIEMTPHRRGIHDRPPSDIDTVSYTHLFQAAG